MPIYEYKCNECGNVHAEVRSAENVRKEAQCQCGGTCRLIMSRPARFQRGPGWKSRMDGADMPGEV